MSLRNGLHACTYITIALIYRILGIQSTLNDAVRGELGFCKFATILPKFVK
jgi:hypothetical protein